MAVEKKKKSTTKSTKVISNKKNNTKLKKKIGKDKLIKIILGTFLLIVLCLICFLASLSNSKDYSSETNASSSSEISEDDNEILAEITKEAGSVSDDERTLPDEITVSDYLDLYKSTEQSLVLISRPTCQYCKIATPIIENIIYETGVKINYINVDNISNDDNTSLISSDSYFSDGYGTPLILVVGDNSIKDKIEGLTTKSDYESFFKQYGFID